MDGVVAALGSTDNGCGGVGADGRVGGLIALLTLLLPLGIVHRELALVNTANIMLATYNAVLLVSVVVLGFYLVGYALSNGFEEGRAQNFFVGERFFFLIYRDRCGQLDVIGELSRAITVAAIAMGAATERIHAFAVVVLSLCIATFVYPVPRFWTAGDHSWLHHSGRSLQDTAGNGSMFVTAGFLALIVIYNAGARARKITDAPFFTINNPSGLFTSTIVTAVGCVFLAAFSSSRRVTQGGDTVAPFSEPDARALQGVVNCLLAFAFGSLSAIGVQRFVERQQLAIKPHTHLRIITAGGLAGIVAISSFADVSAPELILPVAALGGIVCRGIMLLTTKYSLDDATDAVSVYLGGGLVAMLCAPFWDETDGIFFFNGRWAGLGWNIVAILAIMAWCFLLFASLCIVLRLKGMLVYSHAHTENAAGMDVSVFSIDLSNVTVANMYGFSAGVDTPMIPRHNVLLRDPNTPDRSVLNSDSTMISVGLERRRDRHKRHPLPYNDSSRHAEHAHDNSGDDDDDDDRTTASPVVSSRHHAHANALPTGSPSRGPIEGKPLPSSRSKKRRGNSKKTNKSSNISNNSSIVYPQPQNISTISPIPEDSREESRTQAISHVMESSFMLPGGTLGSDEEV